MPSSELPVKRAFRCCASCAGKDLHKLSLPVYVNEPLTDLQRRAEAFEASELLDQVLLVAALLELPNISAPAEYIPCLLQESHPSSCVCCHLAAAAMGTILLPLGESLILRKASSMLSADLHRPCEGFKGQLPIVMLTTLSPVQAALAPFESVERLTLVAAFAISMYNTIKRVQKPFKNLQQSTYELVYPEKGIRAIGEKVGPSPLSQAVCTMGDRFRDTLSLEYCRPSGAAEPPGHTILTAGTCKQSVQGSCSNTASVYSDLQWLI